MKLSKTNYFLLFLIILTIPHILHYIGCKKNDLISFNNLKYSLIFIRGLTIVLGLLWINYFILNGKNTLNNWIPPTNIGLYIGTSFAIIGQFLNYSVYKTLGTDGVYYGLEYGKVKYKEKKIVFPYSVLSAPQYTGAIISLIGVFLMWGIRKNYKIDKYFFILMAWPMLLYALMIKVEKNCEKKN